MIVDSGLLFLGHPVEAVICCKKYHFVQNYIANLLTAVMILIIMTAQFEPIKHVLTLTKFTTPVCQLSERNSGLWQSVTTTGVMKYSVSIGRQAERVTGQFADKPTRGQSSHGLVNSQASQLAEMFDLKFSINNCQKCALHQITLLKTFIV